MHVLAAALRRPVNRYRRLASDLLERVGPQPPQSAAVEPEYRLLVVCHGNSCRSPLAEGILRARLADEGMLGRALIDSAGTRAGDPGAPPNWRARRVARRHGLTIGDLRARRLMPDDLDRFDRILVFDRRNLADVLALARTDEQRRKVSLLLTDPEAEIADPILGGDDEYERCFAAIEAACDRVLADARSHLRG